MRYRILLSLRVWFTATLRTSPATPRPSRLVSTVRRLGRDVEFGGNRRPGDTTIASVSHRQRIGRRRSRTGRTLSDPCNHKHPLLLKNAEQASSLKIRET